MSAIPVASFTKMGDIYVPYCDTSRDLFPLNADASTWSSCDDAYEYTWSLDRGKDLIALTTVDRLKLSRSMGFCPHNRCQLTNLTSTANDGRCPDNLCYTKLENGAKSFGACCFIDGAFNSGQLIGYYNKTQQTPKPMYKKSRVILGDITGGPDESFRGFINANEIHNKLIATQCPLDNTVLDVARMLVEQNVSLWIQLAPFVDIVDTDKDSTHVSQCTITPEKFLNASQHLLRSGNYGSGNYIQDVSLQSTDSNQFKNPSFSARCFDIRYQAPSSEALTTDNQYHLMEEHPMDTSISALDEIQTHRLTNMWYSNWKDFAVPAASDEQVQQQCCCVAHVLSLHVVCTIARVCILIWSALLSCAILALSLYRYHYRTGHYDYGG